MLDIGDKVPAFSLPTNGGGKLSLKDLKGKKAVIYFYPKDMTPGCTTEANDFKDRIKDFQKAGAVVVGVSKDSVTRHDKFVDKYDLPFVLVSDEEGTMCEDFGVWQEKKLYGKTFMGIVRATFVIDEKGKVAAVWPKVKVKGHIDEVLAAVKDL
jgi:peroxiredoxin Q/BCP